jgi:hypothetical protein
MKREQREFMSWIVLCQRKVEMFCAVPIRAFFAPAPATRHFKTAQSLAHRLLAMKDAAPGSLDFWTYALEFAHLYLTGGEDG